MPATVQDILDEGFRPEQFGFNATATAGWSDAGGYLDRACQEAGRWAESRIGTPTYATVPDPSYARDCITRAEVQFVRAILFKRRVAFFDSAANISLQSPLYAERRGYADDAARAMTCAEEWIAAALRDLGLDATADIPGTGASLGVVETGRFAPMVP